MNPELPPSKAEFYVSEYLEELGRAVLAVGVDFFQRNVWIDEAYVIFADPKLSDRCRRSTSCESAEKYEPRFPSPEVVLKDRHNFALGIFWTKLRSKDRDLASHLRQTSQLFSGPLTERSVVGLHFGGEFANQLIDILSFTECSAIRNILRKFERMPKFRIKSEGQKN